MSTVTLSLSIQLVAQLEHVLLTDCLAITTPEAKALLGSDVLKLEGEQASAFIVAAIPLCRCLHAAGRNFDAIPIAQACNVLAERQPNLRLRWQSATVAGILLSHTGDYAGAIAELSRALRLAQSANSMADQASTWTNLGVAFKHAAAYGLAIECFSRVAAMQELGRAFSRYCALVNISHCGLHMGALRMGRAAAKLALKYESEETRQNHIYEMVLLRSNYVRLLVADGKAAAAHTIAEDALSMAEQQPSVLMSITVSLMRAALDVALGRHDVGITRLEGELKQVRELPEARTDTLLALAHAEKAAGRDSRAVVYWYELAEHIYQQAAEQARQHLSISRFFEEDKQIAVDLIDEQVAVLGINWGPMPEWDTFERMAQRANLTTYGDATHGTRVGELARLLALEAGYPGDFASEIGLAARLHDIGLIGVPSLLLPGSPEPAKPDQSRAPVSAIQTSVISSDDLMKRHVTYGYDLLTCCNHPRALLAAQIARYHHECWSGDGYPDGLHGEAIPKAARVTAVVDAFDEVIMLHPQEGPLPIQAACERLQAEAGSKLDPDLVATFMTSIQSGLIGRNLQRPMWLQSMRALSIHELIPGASQS
ncbi:MAG: HD domain-containing protein [Betaproteobacteria bacterium]|nr:HD domain-containing protein [Betaproteobacteria bacterium]